MLLHQILFQFPFFFRGDTPGPAPLGALPSVPPGRGGRAREVREGGKERAGRGKGRGGKGEGGGREGDEVVCVIAVGGDRRP